MQSIHRQKWSVFNSMNDSWEWRKLGREKSKEYLIITDDTTGKYQFCDDGLSKAVPE